MATYRAVHDYTATDQNQLSFKKGDLLVLQSQCGNGWLTVKKGNATGLVPTSYLELVADKETSVDNGSIFVVMYDYTGQSVHQLSVKAGEKVVLVDKHTKEWWTVRNQNGKSGMVPSSYIKMADNTNGQQLAENKATSEVLLSIDNAIEKIHSEATAAGGTYTQKQRATLSQLIAHRQSVVGTKGGETLKEDTPSEATPTLSSHSENVSTESGHRRRAPPPPSNGGNGSSKQDSVKKQDNTETSKEERPKSDIYVTRQAPPPPKRHESLGSKKQLSQAKTEKETPSNLQPPSTAHGDPNEDSVSVSSDGSTGVGPSVGGISPNTTRRINTYLNKAGLESVKEDKIELPTEFPTVLGLELIDIVRESTGLSHGKSAIAVEGVLNHIGEKVPVISSVMTGILEALHKSQLEAQSTATAMSDNKDLIRLKEIFFEIQEARDDSQQRGWAIRDDSGALASFLEELLQLLYDSDPEISRAVIQEDKYENILILVSYYQLEHRAPLRILLMKIFGALFTLDEHVISVVLQTVLPNELGHGIQQNIDDVETLVWSATVCTMMFSTAEELPFSIYDQWNKEFIHFLFECVESPPDSDVDDEIPDSFINALLSFNQHFKDPSTNIVMRVLKESSNPRVFSEKLMLLINRGEDPVSIKAPCCPDSLTKILLDLFADKQTATIFYTSDFMVLIDIITRQLHDLSPGEKLRSHYLELLHRLLSSTDYSDHKHRQQDLITCLKRITNEEEVESKEDREAVKTIWRDFPDVLGGEN